MQWCLFYPEAKFDLADAVSQNNLEVFFDLVPQAAQGAHPLPPGLVRGLVVQRPCLVQQME